MSIDQYIQTQRDNLDSIRQLPHFSEQIPALHNVYKRAYALIPAGTPQHFVMLLLLCEKSLLSAATLIAQAQPDDAAAVTRRAEEIAKVALAVKYDVRNAEKWFAADKRLTRWQLRRQLLSGSTKDQPKSFREEFNLPKDHPVLQDLKTDIGMLSDSFVHFTPEFFFGQNWKQTSDTIQLNFFIADEWTLKMSFIQLCVSHVHILSIFDECLDGALQADQEWCARMAAISTRGEALRLQLLAESAEVDAGESGDTSPTVQP